MLQMLATLRMFRRALRRYGVADDAPPKYPVEPASRGVLLWTVFGVVLTIVVIGVATLW